MARKQNNKIAIELSAKLSEAREKANLTQAEVAKKQVWMLATTPGLKEGK